MIGKLYQTIDDYEQVKNNNNGKNEECLKDQFKTYQYIEEEKEKLLPNKKLNLINSWLPLRIEENPSNNYPWSLMVVASKEIIDCKKFKEVYKKTVN